MAAFGHGGPARFAGGEKYEGNIRDSRIIEKLLKTAVPYWKGFLAALVFILVLAAIEIIQPNIIRLLIDDNIQPAAKGIIPVDTAGRHIVRYGMIFLGLMIAQFVLSYFHIVILQSTGKKIIKDLRDRIFKHIQKLPVSFFDKIPAGVLVTRVTNDSEAINEMYTEILVHFVREMVVIIGVIIVMFGLNVKMTLITIAVTPLVIISVRIFRTRAKKIFNDIRNRLSRLNAFLSENITAVKIIQVFNMTEEKKKEFSESSCSYYKSHNRMTTLFGLFRPFMDFVNNFAIAIIIWFGAQSILNTEIKIGMLFIFIRYANMLFRPIIHLSEMFNIMQHSLVAAERVFKILDMKSEESVKGKVPVGEKADMDISRLKGGIEFKNVWFAYDDENWVLRDVSFKISPGETVAFVGQTGAGKTTIINLLCRFYEIRKGEILIDGINIRDIPKNQLRSSIGLVLQDVQLFSGDIKTNIRLYNDDISDENIKKAAEYVDADRFINRLQQGYDYSVNPGGTTFSSGERQLLSFARAIAVNPAILVLDEATSNIDTETERIIQEAMQKIGIGRTMVVIAHRLSTIKNANRIIVIHKGRLKEEGTHDELIRLGGIYHHLYTLQFI